MHTSLACPLALAMSIAAQTPCASSNAANASVTGNLTGVTGQPNVFAFKVTLPTTAYKAIQIFTGNASFPAGFMQLELWPNDPTTNMPLARHAGGTWRIDASLGNAWQGTNLDLDIVPSAPYWIVWTEPGLSTEPIEPSGFVFPAAQRIGSTWTLLPQPRALKVRLFCQWLEQPNVTIPPGCPINGRGCACPTSTGYWGTLFTNQQPAVGNLSFALEGTGFLPGALAFLGVDPTDSSSLASGFPQFCAAYPGNPQFLFGSTGTGDVLSNWATTGASGHSTFPLPIPPNAALSGLIARAQLAVYDPTLTAPLPFTLSNGLRIVVP